MHHVPTSSGCLPIPELFPIHVKALAPEPVAVPSPRQIFGCRVWVMARSERANEADAREANF